MAIRDLVPTFGGRRAQTGRGGYVEPFSRLHDEMDRLFDDFLPKFTSPSLFEGRLGHMPALDVSETDDAIEVKADLPGLEEKDIDVKLANGVLVISGERKEESEEKKKNYYHAERSYGVFNRSVSLPCEVDEDRIDATFKKGVLTITLPKSAQAKEEERKIQIKTS